MPEGFSRDERLAQKKAEKKARKQAAKVAEKKAAKVAERNALAKKDDSPDAVEAHQQAAAFAAGEVIASSTPSSTRRAATEEAAPAASAKSAPEAKATATKFSKEEKMAAKIAAKKAEKLQEKRRAMAAERAAAKPTADGVESHPTAEPAGSNVSVGEAPDDRAARKAAKTALKRDRQAARKVELAEETHAQETRVLTADEKKAARKEQKTKDDAKAKRRIEREKLIAEKKEKAYAEKVERRQAERQAAARGVPVAQVAAETADINEAKRVVAEAAAATAAGRDAAASAKTAAPSFYVSGIPFSKSSEDVMYFLGEQLEMYIGRVEFLSFFEDSGGMRHKGMARAVVSDRSSADVAAWGESWEPVTLQWGHQKTTVKPWSRPTPSSSSSVGAAATRAGHGDRAAVPPSARLFVTGFLGGNTETDIENWFSPHHPQLVTVQEPKGKSPFAHVTFASATEAAKALVTHNLTFMGGRKVKMQFALKMDNAAKELKSDGKTLILREVPGGAVRTAKGLSKFLRYCKVPIMPRDVQLPKSGHTGTGYTIFLKFDDSAASVAEHLRLKSWPDGGDRVDCRVATQR